MVYNNGFPIGYQQYYPQYYPQYQTPAVQNQQPQTNNGIIWIQGGITGANSYLVGPNTTVALWDSESPIIYLKTSDASGKPSMKILDYTVREEPSKNEANFMTKDDLKDIQEKLANIETRINGLSYKKDNRKDYKNE